MGSGVPQDRSLGAGWIRKAAEQGNASAQFILGRLYEKGTGVQQDYGESYFWVKLAAAGKIPDATPEQLGALLDEIATHLTTAALSQAQQRAREWLGAHPSRQH
jgi:TPR repeat protein